MEETYSDSDVPEDFETAYQKVQSGEWTFDRFQEWGMFILQTEIQEAVKNFIEEM